MPDTVEKAVDKFFSSPANTHFREESREVAPTPSPRPNPGEESIGPALFDLLVRTHRSIDVQAELLKAAIPLLNRRTIVEIVNGNTDASGNMDLVLYRVPQGMQFIVTRVNIENGGNSPASPYTNAAGWIGLMRADKFVKGTLVDFLPNPPVSNGAILPASITDGATEAGLFRGGEIIGLHIDTGPANNDIWVRLQGIQEPV